MACATLLDFPLLVMRQKDDAILAEPPPGVVALGPRQVLLAPERLLRDSVSGPSPLRFPEEL